MQDPKQDPDTDRDPVRDRNEKDAYVSGEVLKRLWAEREKTALVPGVVARARYEPLCCLLYSLLTEYHHSPII